MEKIHPYGGLFVGAPLTTILTMATTPEVTVSDRRPLQDLYMLVVDDNHDSREILRLLLAHSGASVTVASSARCALEALERMTPDVVIADVLLGDTEDGFWLRREAMRRWPHVPFIAISGEDFVRQTLQKAGFVAYLRKPATHDVLIDTVLATLALG